MSAPHLTSGSSRVLPTLLAALVTLTAATTPAAGQVRAQFYAPFNGDTTGGRNPNPTQPYPYGRLVCTTNVGDATGFSLDFLNTATHTFLQNACGTAVANTYLNYSFGARFTGSLVAPSAGSYNLAFNSDDGNWLTINNQFVGGHWGVQAGGPGTITAMLNAGANPFTFDYYANDYGSSYATLQLPAGLTPVPPAPVSTTAPEPATWALLGTGLLTIGGMAKRRRSA